MKKLLPLLSLLPTLACVSETNAGTLRAAILIVLGVVSVVLLILFGKPKKTDSDKK